MLPLAGRGTRLVAAIVDGIIMMVVFGVPMFLILSSFAPQPRVEIDPNAGFWEIYMASRPSLGTQVVNLVIGLAVFTLVHGYFLATNGQTIGKKMLGIKIVRTNGSQPTLRYLIGVRILPFWIINLVPGLGIIVAYLDPLMIFRSSRKCLHDDLADTVVVLAD